VQESSRQQNVNLIVVVVQAQVKPAFVFLAVSSCQQAEHA
jgi:hypothetical protein